MHRKLLTSTLHILCKIRKLLLRKSFWLTVGTKINKTKKLIFSDNLSPYQGKLLHLSNFLRQSVALSGEVVPLEYFLQIICRLITEFVTFDWLSQTCCLRLLIHFIIFLRQSVTILGNLLHLKRLSQTSYGTLLFIILCIYSWFSRWMKVSDSSFGISVLVIMYWVSMASFLDQYSVCIATVKML